MSDLIYKGQEKQHFLKFSSMINIFAVKSSIAEYAALTLDRVKLGCSDLELLFEDA